MRSRETRKEKKGNKMKENKKRTKKNGREK
jgi:hypothetical protein